MEIYYNFLFDGGEAREFRVRLDDRTLSRLGGGRSYYPDWARLSHHQCPNCPLREDEHPRCPIAEGVADVVETFKDKPSSEKVEITIATSSRKFGKRAPVADGVSALLGVCMATSGCPIMDKLKPMVRTHLPFADHNETMYRLLGMYLLAQYFRAEGGQRPDWEFKDLILLIEDLRQVNRSFCDRVRTVCTNDAVVNAVVLLDCFAGITGLSLKTKSLKVLERVFLPHLDERPASKPS